MGSSHCATVALQMTRCLGGVMLETCEYMAGPCTAQKSQGCICPVVGRCCETGARIASMCPFLLCQTRTPCTSQQDPPRVVRAVDRNSKRAWGSGAGIKLEG